MLRGVLTRILTFEREAHSILAKHEAAAPSRVILLEDTYKELGKLSLYQDELFRQSLRCLENKLFRAAHVMAWAAFMDFLEEKLVGNGFSELKAIRPSWKMGSIEELRESANDYQLIEASRALKLVSRTEEKALHGLLNKRNESAHPSDYYPTLNESLGYVSEILQRISQIRSRKL